MVVAKNIAMFHLVLAVEARLVLRLLLSVPAGSPTARRFYWVSEPRVRALGVLTAQRRSYMCVYMHIHMYL